MEFEISKLELKNLISVPIQEIVVLKETGSTNDVAKELFKKGVKTALVVSESQTNGRGRINRKFYSPKDPKIEELALQSQGVGIFTFGEYPSSCANKNGLLLAGRPIFYCHSQSDRTRR